MQVGLTYNTYKALIYCYGARREKRETHGWNPLPNDILFNENDRC